MSMNDKKGLISIIVPVYKAEKYLSRCVESILAQSYRNFEIILIDDDSPDSCPRLCDDYSNQFANIITIHLKDSGIGVSGVRNAGIEAAKGEYITFVDSDDFINNELLMTLKKAIDFDSEVSMSFCSYQKVSGNMTNSDSLSLDDVKLIDDLEAMDLIIEDQNKSAVWGKLYKKSIFEDLRFPIGKHNEDMFLMPFIFHKAQKIAYSSKRLYYYFQDSESLCRSQFNYNMLDMVDAISKWRDIVSINYSILQVKVDCHYFSALINSCQYLVQKKDEYGINKYRDYKHEILNNLELILKSSYITNNNKLKAFLFKLGLFRFCFCSISFIGLKKYD